MISWGMADESGVEQQWLADAGSITSLADIVGDPKMWTEWKVGTTGQSVTEPEAPPMRRSMRTLPATASG